MAEEAGLRYVSDAAPGIRRVRRGGGYSYRGASGVSVSPATRAWIESLAIPPAWSDVWISADRSGHILATGVDSVGRKQYIYHPAWEKVRDEVKFDRMGEFGLRLARLRRTVDHEMRQSRLSHAKVTALAVAVLDTTLIRVGTRRYAVENEAFGLTTITPDHVTIEGAEVQLEFTGKGGADQQIAFSDRRLASLIARCQELDGQTLFSYRSGDGLGSVSSTDVNGYVSRVMRGAFTAKDFRTWGATVCVAEELMTGPTEPGEQSVRRAIDCAAERLGNTRAVCRASYVHPIVTESFRDGTLESAWRKSRSGRWLGRSESAVNRLLTDCASSLAKFG